MEYSTLISAVCVEVVSLWPRTSQSYDGSGAWQRYNGNYKYVQNEPRQIWREQSTLIFENMEPHQELTYVRHVS